MKLNKFLALACLALAFTVCDSPTDAASGGNSPGENTPDTPESTPEPPMDVSPAEALALLHLDKDPVQGLEELTVVVEDFLSDAANISGMVNIPVITEVAAHTITVPSGFAVKSPDSDVETIPESSELPFYRYTLEDTATGATGVLIASGDKRIGGVIAYIEEETDDASVNPFMDILADRLTAYVNRTIDAYNSITSEDAQTVNQILSQKANQSSAYLRSVSPIGKPEKGTDFLPLIETRWNQNDGYWDMVNNPGKSPDNRVVYSDGGLSSSKDGFYAGCVAVAMGQVMAYHEWPDRCSLPGYWQSVIMPAPLYNTIGNPDDNPSTPRAQPTTTYFSFSDFVYDWKAMKAKPEATDLGTSNYRDVFISEELYESGRSLINVLLYESGVNVGMNYGKGVSTATTNNIVPAFYNFGYDVSESAIRDYDYNTIAASIDRKLPVIISASSHITTKTTTTYYWLDLFNWFPQTTTHITVEGGHAWVIDDYHAGSETFTSGGKSFQRPVYLVHCNLGWGGYKNGWYADGLFDTRGGTTVDDTPRSVIPGALRSATTEGADYVYKYLMKIIPFVKKAQND